MFMRVVRRKLDNKLDLNWKQSFLIVVMLKVTDISRGPLMKGGKSLSQEKITNTKKTH
jgi:hypothetical protein